MARPVTPEIAADIIIELVDRPGRPIVLIERLYEPFGLYSDPTRDHRGHTVTAVYVGEASGVPIAADDAKAAVIVHVDQIPSPLAFDHRQVLDDYLDYRERGTVTPLCA